MAALRSRVAELEVLVASGNISLDDARLEQRNTHGDLMRSLNDVEGRNKEIAASEIRRKLQAAKTEALKMELAAEREAAHSAARAAAAQSAEERANMRAAAAKLESELEAEIAQGQVDRALAVDDRARAASAAAAAVDVTQRLTDVTEEVSRAEKKQRQLECQVGEADGRLDEVRTELRALDSTSAEKQLVAKQREADLVAQRNGFAVERDNALDGLSKLLAERAIALSNHAAEIDALREIVKVGEADAVVKGDEADHAVNVVRAAAAAAETRTAQRVHSLELELRERTMAEAAARSDADGRGAVCVAMSHELLLLRTTWRSDLTEVHRAAVAAAAEAEAAAQLQLAAGVAVMKRGRNGKLYSRMVRCHLPSNALEWATLGKFKRMSVKGAHVEFAPGASEFVVKGAERDYTVEVTDTPVAAWARALHRRLGAQQLDGQAATGTPAAAPRTDANGVKSLSISSLSPLPPELAYPMSPAASASVAASIAARQLEVGRCRLTRYNPT